MPDREFDEEHESECEEREPPGQIPEKLGECHPSNIQTEEKPLAERAQDIDLCCPLIQKASSKGDEPKREKCRNEQCQGEEKYSLTCDREGHRIDSKNENAEDAEGREREETKDDN